ncbi:hypothetical protein PVAP13_7KG035509 [Panicum virgatum]|uniref:Pullulanase N2 domain-containing protein n=1 Tax=Panicum virgatum TaxID=38727 RepID=A0A8T0Q6V0_PANVG|nr:hypothetical protein PVAP13_7KG035509 [Panicum virgatum]
MQELTGVTKSLIAWDVSDQETSLYLYASRSATMCMSNGVVEGYDSKVQLQLEHGGLQPVYEYY